MRDGGHASRADLARKLHCSRARVSQGLRLLTLDQEVIDDVFALGDPLPRRSVSEQKLRAMADLPAEEQRRRLDLMLRAAP